MRDVLVCVRDPAQWGHAGAYATDIAARLGGTLTGVCIEPASQTPLAVPGAGADVAVGTMTARQRSGNVRAAEGLAAWANAMGTKQTAWHEMEGSIADVLARMSAWHDLIVVDRDMHDPAASVHELGEVVVSSRAPVILVPPRRREALLDCIALAWNRSEESLAAIHAARPLLAHAKRIVVLEGGDAEQPLNEVPGFELARYLAWQGFTVEHDTIRGESSQAGDLLIHAARRHRADLLVMGAYGRSRLSEWVLGGATRSVLFDAPLPVFLKH